MAIIGGLALVGGVILGISTHAAAVVATGLVAAGALMLVAGIRGRWRGNRMLTELRQKAVTRPVDARDLLPWLDLRPAIRAGIGIGLVVAAVVVAAAIVFTRR
jgi:hypothetical protein